MIATPKVEILAACGDRKITRVLQNWPEELHRAQIESAVMRIAPRKVDEGIVRIDRRRREHRADGRVSCVDLLKKGSVGGIDQKDVAVASTENREEAQLTVALVDDRFGNRTNLCLHHRLDLAGRQIIVAKQVELSRHGQDRAEIARLRIQRKAVRGGSSKRLRQGERFDLDRIRRPMDSRTRRRSRENRSSGTTGSTTTTSRSASRGGRRRRHSKW